MLGRAISGLIVVLAFIVPLEIVSWWPSPVSGPCLIKPEQETAGGQNNYKKTCVTFVEGSIVLLGRADKFFEHHDKSILAVFTIVLAVSTTLLWWSTDKLWRAGERQMELIDANSARQASDMKASIQVAQNTAMQAKRAADVAEQSLVSTQRAFVFVQKFDGIAWTDPDDQKVRIWKIWPIWGNSGTTPSRQLFNYVSWMPFEGDIPPDFSFSDVWSPGISTEQTRLFLGPKGSINGQTVAIPIANLLEVAAGKRRVFVWGWVEYDDVFPNTPPHRTEFCVEIIVVGDPEVANFKHISPALYARHNGAEEECYRAARPAANRFLPLV